MSPTRSPVTPNTGCSLTWEAAIAIVVAAVAGGWAIFVHDSRPDDPGAFYTAPSPLPDGPPGTIIRSEVIDDFYSGATA